MDFDALSDPVPGRDGKCLQRGRPQRHQQGLFHQDGPEKLQE